MINIKELLTIQICLDVVTKQSKSMGSTLRDQ